MRVICVDDAAVILEHTVKLCEGMPQIDEVKGFTNPLEALDFVKRGLRDGRNGITGEYISDKGVQG